MLHIKERPYFLLLLTAIVILVATALLPIANMNFQDITLFGISLAIMVRIIPIFLASLWLLYRLTNKLLFSLTFTRLHVFITVFTTILIIIVMITCIHPISTGAKSISGISSSDRQELIGNVMQLLFLLFVFGQIFYPVNIFLGLFSKKVIDKN